MILSDDLKWIAELEARLLAWELPGLYSAFALRCNLFLKEVIRCVVKLLFSASPRFFLCRL